MTEMKPRKWSVMQMVAGILTIGLLAGCAANQVAEGDYGSLKLSLEVSQIFEKYQVLPQYKYYYTGSDTKPQAIIGIDRNYTLDTRLWKEAADLTSEQLKKWVDQILNFLPPVRTFGSYILDANGRPVGIWYSAYDYTPVKMLADNRIEIVPPSYARNPSLPRGVRGFGFGFGMGF